MDFHGQELPINCDFFLELKPLLLIFFSILKLWVNKRTSSNSRLNQDQSNHFIANAEHFEIFGRKGKRNSVEHKRYQSDNISENVILTRKSLQIAMLLISPYLKDI